MENYDSLQWLYFGQDDKIKIFLVKHIYCILCYIMYIIIREKLNINDKKGIFHRLPSEDY